ncbi:MAG: hypothetical protein HDQ95_03960 [Roseburia sp.]|nr:hypothetical protein [Roseburia sp.]
MRYWMIGFEIDNNQEEYARCLQVIDMVKNMRQRDFADADFWQKVKYKNANYEMSFLDIVKGGFVVCETGLPKIDAEDICRFFFEVNCADADDIINLIYFCLINDRIDGSGILCVKCQGKIEYNIRDFLLDVLISGVINECYYLSDGIYKRFMIRNVRKNRRFSPVFRISQNGRREERVTYWRQSVQTFFRELYSQIEIGERDSKYTVNYFLPHIAPAELKKKYPQDVWNSNTKRREVRLVNNFVECFCSTEEKISVGFMEKRYEWWKSKEFFEKIRYMPLLALYIFCLSDYYQKDVENDSWENIEQEIFDARDMAEGFLQILENIYHSEYQEGYFCFRIHNNTPKRSGPYLKKEYSAYMKSRSERTAPLNYLEMKVVDFSHRTIPMQFNEDFSKRMEQADDAEKRVYEEIMSEAVKLKVSSFYDETTEFWKQYNSLSENVIHHYGIQIFQSLIACCHGYFQVRSQRTEQADSDKEFYSTIQDGARKDIAIPGTQYDALIPLGKQDMMQNISMDVNLKYDNNLIDQYGIYESEMRFNAESIKSVLGAEKDSGSFQDKKELAIRVLEKQFEKSIEEYIKKSIDTAKKYIIHISAKDVAITAVEIFCKTLMLYIARKGQEKDCYIMVTECTQSHFAEIARMMALFYNKQGINQWMERTQIFMSGQEESEEFLITGTNLEKAVAGTEKLAFARSVHPNCLKSLRKSLKNHMVTGEISPNDVVNIVPFDMIKYRGEAKTLMERRMQKVLEQDVQSEAFGCRLENLHVRIGSKIHIRTFYEAELLFHNNYYTLRFAYWLYNELNTDKRLNVNNPFMLVGYEDYSEMLINELCNMFHNGSGIKPEYIIYEERSAGKFRGKRDLSQYQDVQFIIIVPINSTTTTHIKIAGFLEKTIRSSMRNGSGYCLDRNKVLNYGVVLISSETSNMYWDRCEKENTIISLLDGKELKYYVEVQSKWEEPLRCEACFPKDDYTMELPLVETNKESVVPMHAISIRRSHPQRERERDANGADSERAKLNRLKELSQVLIYRHVERNGNHFNYYFSTEKLWENEQIKSNIERWLQEQGRLLFTKEEYKVYDIIVAPLHYSNTVFVEEVNNWLFSNAALVLHFDADREFRMNVRTKYSSVQQLYDNLNRGNEKAAINFHYIDDTIISGRTYQRMKSLVRSLIYKDAGSPVEINIFKSVVLLVNRMSASSISDYIGEPRYFMAYFNLSISSMRVNSDACVLCKKYGEWSKLSEQASLNEVYIHWKDKSRRIKCVPVEQLDAPVEYPARAIQYMLASHRAKRLLDEICGYAGQDEIIEQIIEQLFPENAASSPDELIAMLKILGRPFMTFRREEKEAVFKLMLSMLDVLLGGECPAGDDKLQRILQDIYRDSDTRIAIVGMLINRLAELESNYIIRKRNIENILAFAEKYIEDPKRCEEFTSNYLNRIKQLVGQSNDFAKGLYLEYLLLYGKEYNKINDGSMDMTSLMGNSNDAIFRRKVYLENTKLVNYGIEYLADCFWNISEYTEDTLKEALNGNYYFDNFIQYLAFHRVVEMDGKEHVKCFVSETEVKKLIGMVRFELLYQRIFGRKKISGLEDEEMEETKDRLQDKFDEMMEYLKAASGASDGEIIVPYEKDKKYTDGVPKHIALGLRKGTELREFENNEQDLLDFMRQDRAFEGDTYAVCDGKGTYKWVLFKFYDRTGTNNSNTTDIYMLFPFDTEDEGELLHAIKNILIFRNKIWRILNLSSDVLLQNLTDNLFYKQQMLKSRAVGHSEFSASMKQLKEVSKLINESEDDGKREEDTKLIKNHFELLVNSMIGFMNAQVLGGKGADYADHSKTNEFYKFWEIEENVVKASEKIWNLQIVPEKDEQFKTCVIRKMKNCDQRKPTFDVLLVLFLAVFQNIQKHKGNNDTGPCSVTVYAEEGKICIKNCIPDSERERIEEAIKSKSYRAGEGISLAVICDICRAYFPETKYAEMFEISSLGQTESGGNECEFVVKLPITEQNSGETAMERWESI